MVGELPHISTPQSDDAEDEPEDEHDVCHTCDESDDDSGPDLCDLLDMMLPSDTEDVTHEPATESVEREVHVPPMHGSEYPSDDEGDGPSFVPIWVAAAAVASAVDHGGSTRASAPPHHVERRRKGFQPAWALPTSDQETNSAHSGQPRLGTVDISSGPQRVERGQAKKRGHHQDLRGGRHALRDLPRLSSVCVRVGKT